ncbi:MAG: hypothetical protein JXA82_07820 [Sedimentisphaerales bacterium]|nr:hypothetical protein [Sedimentisphaerales bacterium]
MAPRRRKKSETVSLEEFVTVAFAEDVDLAKQYKKLLNDSNIPAAVKTGPDPGSSFPGVAVMVPEEFLDEAHLLIESEGACSDFYDMVFHEEDDDILEDELYDEDC